MGWIPGTPQGVQTRVLRLKGILAPFANFIPNGGGMDPLNYLGGWRMAALGPTEQYAG